MFITRFGALIALKQFQFLCFYLRYTFPPNSLINRQIPNGYVRGHVSVIRP